MGSEHRHDPGSRDCQPTKDLTAGTPREDCWRCSECSLTIFSFHNAAIFRYHPGTCSCVVLSLSLSPFLFLSVYWSQFLAGSKGIKILRILSEFSHSDTLPDWHWNMVQQSTVSQSLIESTGVGGYFYILMFSTEPSLSWRLTCSPARFQSITI